MGGGEPGVPTIGAQELELLQFIGDQGRTTVAQAVEGFGTPRGLARSTVLTMIERLRRKGYLTRRQIDGVYHYRPSATAGATLRQVVETFVTRTLRGSVAPFVSYLAEREHLSDEEIAQLKALLKRMRPRRQGRN